MTKLTKIQRDWNYVVSHLHYNGSRVKRRYPLSEPDIDPLWQEDVYDLLSDDAYIPLVDALYKAGVPIPVVGLDLDDERGITTGAEAELCWPELHIALVVEQQLKSTRNKPASSWRVYDIAQALRNPSSITSMFGHGWLEEAAELIRRGEHVKGLDLVYVSVDSILLRGDFKECDSLLTGADPEQLPTRIILGLLTVTLAAQDQLLSRSDFFLRSKSALEKRAEYEPGLLAGLQG